MLQRAVAVDVLGAGHQAPVVHRQAADPGSGDQLHPELDRVTPVRDVGAGLGADGAAGFAGAVAHARFLVLVLARRDGVRRRPPVPAELVHPLGRDQAVLADRQRRQREGVRIGVCRVALEPGRADVVGDLVVERPKILVGERPILGDTVEGLHPEVRRHRPHPVPGEQDGAAADTVEHQRLDRAVGAVDRIVGLVLPDIRAGVPLLEPGQFPFRLARGEVVGQVPAALLQADDLQALPGQFQGRNAAGCSGADDEDIGLVIDLSDTHHSRSRSDGYCAR